MPTSWFNEEGLRCTQTGVGELGLSLIKHLAGSPISIREEEFIAWVKAGAVPDEQCRFALHEALMNMDAEVRRALFDGRATRKEIAALAVHCGADRNPLWNNLIQIMFPELEPRTLPEDAEWEKLLMWEAGGHFVEF